MREQEGKESGEEIWPRLEQDRILSCHSRSKEFLKAKQAYETVSDNVRSFESGCAAALFGARLTFPDEEDRKIYGRFAPMLVLADGRRSALPQDMGADGLTFYERWSQMTSNPIHAARCHDSLWESRKDHMHARKAVNAYLQCSRIHIQSQSGDWPTDCLDAVSRSVELAVLLGDKPLIRGVVDECLCLAKELQERGEHGWLATDILDAALSGIERGARVDPQDVYRLLDAALVGQEGRGVSLHEQHILEVRAKAAKVFGDAQAEASAKIEKARMFERLGDQCLASPERGRRLAATSWYMKSLKAYKEAGAGKNEISRVRKNLKQAGQAAESEMPTFQASTTIPGEVVRKLHSFIESLSVEHAVAALGTDLFRIVPDRDTLLRQAAERAKQFPLQSVFPRVVISDGKIVAAGGSPQEELELTLVRDRVLTVKIAQQLIFPKVFAKLESTPQEAEDAVREFLRATGFVSEERCELVRQGLERYFAKDFVSSICILVFQIEGILRDMLAALSADTTTETKGIQREATLGAVISRLKSHLDNNLLDFLLAVLCEPAGLNLRNEVGHGLMRLSGFARDTARTLIHCLLLICRYQVRSRESAGSNTY